MANPSSQVSSICCLGCCAEIKRKERLEHFCGNHWTHTTWKLLRKRKERICTGKNRIQSLKTRDVFPTRHVDHFAVAVLHQVSRLAVDPAGRDAVAAEEVGIHWRGLAVTPGRRQVCQLRAMEAPEQNHLEQPVYWTSPLVCEVLMQWFDLSGGSRCAFI